MHKMLNIRKIATTPTAIPTTIPVDRLLEPEGGDPDALGAGGDELRPGFDGVVEGGLFVRDGGGGDAKEPGVEGLVGFDGGGGEPEEVGGVAAGVIGVEDGDGGGGDEDGGIGGGALEGGGEDVLFVAGAGGEVDGGEAPGVGVDIRKTPLVKESGKPKSKSKQK